MKCAIAVYGNGALFLHIPLKFTLSSDEKKGVAQLITVHLQGSSFGIIN